MRRLLIALAISLLPSIALAAPHGGGRMGGATHMGATHGRMGGPAFSSRAAVGTARVGGWNSASWNGAKWNHGAFRHGRFGHHRHNRFFFAGGLGLAGYGYYDSWRWAPRRGDCAGSRCAVATATTVTTATTKRAC